MSDPAVGPSPSGSTLRQLDPVTALLEAPRARDAFLLRVTMNPPWSVWIQDEAPLAVVAVTAGSACYAPVVGDPVVLESGDLLLIARPDPYLFANTAGSTPQAIIHPGGRCEAPTGLSLDPPTFRGVRTWGNAATGRDVMLVGTYPRVNEVCARLLRTLPPAIVMRAGEHQTGLIDVLAQEINGEGIGQASLLDRVLDGLTVTVIRHWASSPEADPPGWIGTAGRDPVISAALDLMHDPSAHPWTVTSLARAVGMSRAGFSRRFAATVGESPMAYLTAWRLAVAADQLREDDTPVFQVATAVGYTSPFTFSTAFKRHYGLSPLAYREQVTTSPATANDLPPAHHRGLS